MIATSRSSTYFVVLVLIASEILLGCDWSDENAQTSEATLIHSLTLSSFFKTGTLPHLQFECSSEVTESAMVLANLQAEIQRERERCRLVSCFQSQDAFL